MHRPALVYALAAVLVAGTACTSDPQPQGNAPSAGAPGAGPAPGIPVNDNPPAENDPQRTNWRIDVAPEAVIGSGHPGKLDDDIDKPDGVAFTPNGLLLATDAGNRRVQVWDVKTNKRIGDFGHHTFGGEIVDIAVLPNGMVLVTDQTLNLAYAFMPPDPNGVDPDTGKPLGPDDYQFKGTRFGEQGFDKLGGIAADSKGRIYCVDAHLNDVRRFKPDFTVDETWHFEKTKASGDTYLHGCEGIAIDEERHNLFVSSEKDAVVQVFDAETGRYKQSLVGALSDGSGAPKGKHVFFASVEGLAIAQNHLLAVDEAAGHIQVFDLTTPAVFNTDLVAYSTRGVDRGGGYQGFFGHAPRVDFENKANVDLQKKVKDGSVQPGQQNPPGFFCSPDSIASYHDQASGETYIAIADQCNYRVAVYKWSDVAKAIGPTVQTRDLASTAGGLGGLGGGASAPAEPAPPAHHHDAPASTPPPRRPAPRPAVHVPANDPKPDKKDKGKHKHAR